ncbi:MAG: gluconate 2-dehydrogenase subunit 3 family protein [Imperialibacter sp.]|uniref:gluconate 2-dehydrogenase subunit 3 family protein n=1 Tax=Imperialibacter sp. TaxID=2038411 RepID=UPI0032EF8507
MNRRQAISATALLMGGTMVGAQAFLSGCKPSAPKEGLFGADDIALLDEVGETILPTTEGSAGAKAAKIGEFMKVIVTDCYSEEEQKVFTEGLVKLNKASQQMQGDDFMVISSEKRELLLVALLEQAEKYNESKAEDEPVHYFTMMHQLTNWGYFSSEPGATQALRYIAVPGRWEGCVSYAKGDRAWA